MFHVDEFILMSSKENLAKPIKLLTSWEAAGNYKSDGIVLLNTRKQMYT